MRGSLSVFCLDQDGFLIIRTNSNFTAAGEMQLERQGFHRLGFYDSRAFIVDKSQKTTMQSPYTYDLKSSLKITAKNRTKTGLYECD